MVGIKDIARKLGVSPATVSLALNGSPLVGEQTKERVCQTAKEMGYRPNPYARSLVTKRSRTLGLVIPDIRNVYYASLVHHINHAVRAADYSLIISMSENDPAYEEKIVREMIDHRVDGLLMAPLNSVGHTHAYLEGLPMPLLFVASRYEDLPYPVVMPDFEGSMAEMTRYAMDRGHKRLLFLTGPEGEVSLDARKRGFLSVSGAGAQVLHCTEVSYTAGASAAEALLAEGRLSEIDCILCVNDTMAAGVENVLLRHGIAIPDRIAVGGFDDILFAETTAVPLTTVRQDIRCMAKTSVQLLLARIGGEEIPVCTVTPTQMVVRESMK